jgi:DNA-binding GntR family transcriptional regulator
MSERAGGGSDRQPLRLAVSRAPLREEIRRALLRNLLRGDPPPGTSISEPVLAAALGISRTPLREALLGLAAEGMLSSEPGRGFFVAPLTRREVEEIYPMLWTLESLALETSEMPVAARLKELESINRRLSRFSRDPEAALESDRHWHEALLEGCPNTLLLDTLAALKNRAFRYEFAYMRGSGRVITSVAQHREIIDALRQGDRGRAVARLESNWRVSVEFLVPWLEAGRK